MCKFALLLFELILVTKLVDATQLRRLPVKDVFMTFNIFWIISLLFENSHPEFL